MMTDNISLHFKKAYLAVSLLVLALSGPALDARPHNLDSLYVELDKAIDNSPQYVMERRNRIRRLQKALADAVSSTDRLSLNEQLFEEYRSFRTDSARFYLKHSMAIAGETGNTQQAARYLMDLAYLNANSGFYAEAMEIMEGIRPEDLHGEVLGTYNMTMNYLYGELAYYTPSDEDRERYYALQDHYFRQMEVTLPHDDDKYLQRLEQNYYAENNTDKALEINHIRLSAVKKGDRSYAVVAFYRYLDYARAGDSEEAMHWITEAAISDIRNAVMDQGAMWELANLLMNQGDIELSYKYISFAWECAGFFGTRLRSWQISPVLSQIEKSYREALTAKNRVLSSLLVILFSLTAVLLLLVNYINRQKKRLAHAGEQLEGANAELSSVNKTLSSLNIELSETSQEQKILNEQLLSLNAELSESNKVKEEYIGRFLQLCSMYIDKMDAMRKRINKMIRLQNFEELRNLAGYSELAEKELDDLYASFDNAFLHLFPNFVADFNKLLKPEERIVLTEENRLNTQLRIFALIRLGIEDSSKIAEFLHYSVNTIYNYRARIKNGAAGSRDDFEQQVKQIGMPSRS